jgi:hypothetical protein
VRFKLTKSQARRISGLDELEATFELTDKAGHKTKGRVGIDVI